MPRRFFRKFALKRDTISRQWYLTPFRHLLHDHRLWGVRRRTVVPAFSLGLFISALPVPGHMLVAALAALALRINIPVASLATLVSNPLTVVPIYLLGYRIGAKLLSVPPRPIEFDVSIEWLTQTFVSIWQPMLLGSVLVGAALALVGHALLEGLWRLSLSSYKKRKRRAREP